LRSVTPVRKILRQLHMRWYPYEPRWYRTGGYKFRSRNFENTVTIYELETMLYLQERPPVAVQTLATFLHTYKPFKSATDLASRNTNERRHTTILTEEIYLLREITHIYPIYLYLSGMQLSPNQEFTASAEMLPGLYPRY
jgi:hypothetical protein